MLPSHPRSRPHPRVRALAAGAAAVLAAAGRGRAGAAAPPGAAPSPPPAPPAAGGAGPAASGAPGARPGAAPMRPFADVTKGATARAGFFDTYEKDGRLLMAVPRDRVGEQFLMGYEIAQGVGSRGLFGGTMLDIFDGQVVSIAKKGDRAFLVRHQTRFTADPGSPMARAVELSFGESVLDQAPVVSVRPDSAWVLDVTDWFVSDLSDVGSVVRQAVAPPPRPGMPPTPGRATLDKTRSYLEGVKSFPRNLNVRAKLTFQPGEPVSIAGVPDSRYVPVSIHYTLARLPEVPMTPRLADDRMGYFLTAVKDFSSTGDTFFKRYVNRWRLECSDQVVDGLCVPKKPIVYYLDRTVPEEYRGWVAKGVNDWSKAFEAAGFRDAVRAELLPEGADPEDLRYPTIRWNTSDEPGYGAIGPSITDPRTGEILDADILVEASMIQGFRRSWKTLVTPAQALGATLGTDEQGNALAADPGRPGREHALFGPSLAAQGGLLRAMLVASGELAPEAAVPSEMVGQAIGWVTMHEVGHTLGLRHNFRSSSDTPLEKLGDRAWLEEHGVFSSVMEYPTINLAGRPGGRVYYNTGPGSSDRWVIAYGYTPSDTAARRLAREGARPGHAFGTDEDAYGPAALDPSVAIFDLSADPLAWGKERAALVASLIPSLPRRVLVDDARHADVTDAFNLLVGQYVQAVGVGLKYLGGQYTARDHHGDADARPPFRPVPRARQLEALDFVATMGFGERAFDYPREVLAALGANRWSHWGEDNTFGGRIDYPLHERVLGAQRQMLAAATNPFLFARVRDAEAKFGAGEVVTIPEMMSRLTASVWSEAMGGSARPVRATRRDLQRAHLDRLGELVVADVPRLPADARSVARWQLASLKQRLDGRLAGGGLDAYTRAHFAESSARIGKLLGAELETK